MQGVKGGEERPKPGAGDFESASAKQFRKAGFERAQAEEGKKQGTSVVGKLQESTAQIKDYGADKMDKIGDAMKNTHAVDK